MYDGHVISYVEKKSEDLCITNKPGACICLFKVPEFHKAYDRPGRAAEVDFKTVLLNSCQFSVRPTRVSGSGEGDFSSSLEYNFVEALQSKAALVIFQTFWRSCADLRR